MQTPYANVEKICIYDPVFILRFSIHSLSMGYIEPMEFASLGLLAIAFVSISSPHDEMRKLGYKALGRFKTALEVLLSFIKIAVYGICCEYCKIFHKFGLLFVLPIMCVMLTIQAGMRLH